MLCNIRSLVKGSKLLLFFTVFESLFIFEHVVQKKCTMQRNIFAKNICWSITKKNLVFESLFIFENWCRKKTANTILSGIVPQLKELFTTNLIKKIYKQVLCVSAAIFIDCVFVLTVNWNSLQVCCTDAEQPESEQSLWLLQGLRQVLQHGHTTVLG